MNRQCVLVLSALAIAAGLSGWAGAQSKPAEEKASDAVPAVAAPPAAPPAAAKADGVRTIESLFRDRATVGGQTVTVRGKVVKAKSGIMGKTWIHIQDGTGGPGTNDLTVTTAGDAAVGSKVLVRGVAAVNKDFGAGYRYDLIIEGATVTAE